MVYYTLKTYKGSFMKSENDTGINEVNINPSSFQTPMRSRYVLALTCIRILLGLYHYIYVY